MNPLRFVGRRKQAAHLWDATLCIHCGACSVACAGVNHPDLALAELPGNAPAAANIQRVELVRDGQPMVVLTQCQQCAAAPCMGKCPAKAIYRDQHGLVRTDEAKCIKCGMCVAGCPYAARWMHPVSAIPQHCMGSGCRALVASGQQPACVQACPTNARSFGDTKDPGGGLSRRLAQPGTVRVRFDQGTRGNLFIVERVQQAAA